MSGTIETDLPSSLGGRGEETLGHSMFLSLKAKWTNPDKKNKQTLICLCKGIQQAVMQEVISYVCLSSNCILFVIAKVKSSS